jgi:hypothetical protein
MESPHSRRELAVNHSLHLNFNDYDSPVDVIDALALRRFLDGTEPWARTVKLPRARAEATLLPEGSEAELVAVSDDRTATLARGKNWTLRSVRWADHSATISVTATTQQIGQAVLDQACAGAEEPDPEPDSFVRATFTHLGTRGAARQVRNLKIEPWTKIRCNYNHSVALALDALMSVTPESLAGRLMLMHGPPGTGKTTALRALANAWRSWCDLEFVIDPERLLANSGYLLSLALGDEGDREGERRWRLLLLEDCDELISSNAKAGSGQSLARLLNLTDGLLGQGLSVIVAITTNEPLQRLHPAVTRPGRCLAEIEVGPLSADEVRRRLPTHAQVSGPMTLAELLAVEGARPLTRREAAQRIGQYL